MQVPAPSRVIGDPFTPPGVHTAGVVVVNVTASPDDAFAVTFTGDCSMVLFVTALNVIVCVGFTTAKLRDTAVAGL